VLLDALITAEYLLLLSGVVFTVQQVSLLVLKFAEHIFALLPELDLVNVGLTLLMEHDNHTDDVKFLLVNTGLVEEPLFVQLQHFLFKFNFLILDVLAGLIQSREPSTAFVLLLSLKLGEEFGILDFLFFVHFFFRLVHPLFFFELLLTTALIDLHDKFSSTVHGFETTATDIVTLETSFSFLNLACFFGSSGLLLLSQVPLNSDVFGVDFENVIGLFQNVGRKSGVLVSGLFKVLKELINRLLSFIDFENSFFLLVL
jgi:hypothetical protein